MKTIAVIMPTYKSHKTIMYSIASIVNQVGIDFKIYVSVDGEEEGSYDYIKDTFPEVEILYSPINRGPGGARQYGIDNTKEDFIIFIDSDDAFNNLSALYTLYSAFDENTVAVWSPFTAQNDDGTFYVKDECFTWMHGKMYRRSFLDKYLIRFNVEYTNSNEDMGFNSILVYCSNETTQKIKVLQNNVYLWKLNPDSIVRRNNREFAWTKSVEGYIQNKIYALNHCIYVLQFPVDFELKKIIGISLYNIFKNYYGIFLDKPGYTDIFTKYSKIFYKEMYEKFINNDDDKEKVNDIELKIIEDDAKREAYTKWKISLKEEN